jgi:hypothetical protein
LNKRFRIRCKIKNNQTCDLGYAEEGGAALLGAAEAATLGSR